MGGVTAQSFPHKSVRQQNPNEREKEAEDICFQHWVME
jgi:hypothetical protein